MVDSGLKRYIVSRVQMETSAGLDMTKKEIEREKLTQAWVHPGT